MFIDDEDMREGDPELIRDLLQKRLKDLRDGVKKGTVKSDLDAFIQLVDYAAWFSSCVSCFVKNLGAVLTGDTGTIAWVNEIMGQIDRSYWDTHYNPNTQLGQSGFAGVFQDPGAGGNQAHHYWFYVQVGFQQSEMKNAPSGVFAALAVIAHETFATRNAAGNSFQDIALGFEGVNLGVNLWAGTISPSEVGNYIRQTLSPGSTNATYWGNVNSQLNRPLC